MNGLTSHRQETSIEADSVAPLVPAPSAVRPRLVNAMTIDVEDYFHVSVFDGVIPRHLWARHGEPCHAQHRAGCSRYSPSGAWSARSSCSAGSPSAIRISCAASLPPATRSRPTAMAIGWSTTRRQRPSETTSVGPRPCSRTSSGGQCSATRAQLLHRAAIALGAGRPASRKAIATTRASSPSGTTGTASPCRRRHPYVVSRPNGSIVEAPASTVRLGFLEPARCRRRLFPDPAVRLDPVGHGARQPAGGPSRRSSICTPGRSIPNSRACRLDC